MSSVGRCGARALLALLALVAATPVQAHKPSDSYLTLAAHGSEVRVRWDVALRDLDDELGLDTDDDGRLTWSEVRLRWPDIDAALLASLTIGTAGRPCARDRRGVEHALDRHSDGTYAVLRYSLLCPAAVTAVDVDYRLFAIRDPTHRGVVRFTAAGAAEPLDALAVLGPDAPTRTLGHDARSRLAVLGEFVVQGIWHIWIGLDHVLFLLVLLLPSVLVRSPPGSDFAWQPVPRFATAAREVLKVVTAFTLAHSITLTLAVLGRVSVPPRVVESVIAVTVILAALNNLWPVVRDRRWLAAFAFGLVHGFGFAAALADIGLPRERLATALLGFNLGVELGQLAIVAAFVPLAYLLRTTRVYRRRVVSSGSALAAAVAAVWFVERAFDLRVWGVWT